MTTSRASNGGVQASTAPGVATFSVEKANTRIDYMYRDASNYKEHLSFVLDGAMSLQEATRLCRFLGGDGDDFLPLMVGLEAADWSSDGGGGRYKDDHPWHELTRNEPTDAEGEGVTVPQVLAAMEALLEAPLARTTLAALAGVSVRQLERLFADGLGHGLHWHYLGVRLDRARQLRRETALTAAQIAAATGFAGADELSRAERRRAAGTAARQNYRPSRTRA